MTSWLLQFVYAPARKMEGLQRGASLCRRVSNRGVSILVGTRFCFAKSSVLYLCFRLTRKRGWRRALRCSRVWQQTLFRGSRTGGFCDTKVTQMRNFEKQNPTGRRRNERYIHPRPAAATPLFQRFFRFPLPWVIVVFPRWLIGLFMCLDFLRIPISETNSSFVSVS